LLKGKLKSFPEKVVMRFLTYEYRVWNNFIPVNEQFIALGFRKQFVNLAKNYLSFFEKLS